MKARKKKKMNKETRNVLIVSIVLFVLLIAGGTFFVKRYTDKIKREFSEKNMELEERISGATRTVYRAINDIKKGEILSDENLEVSYDSLSDDPYESFITEEDLGKEATIDIPAGQAVTMNMATSSLSENWHERELDCIWMSSNLQQYDWVDVRILFPDGEDYIVLSKKCIRKLNLSINNAFWWLNEDELLAIDAAIVDANRHGAKIYTTRYMKPAIQEAHKVTYQPTEEIIDLMKSDPNIVEESERKLSKSAREAMEAKLDSFKSDVTDQQNAEALEGYDFNLDDTTNAVTEDGDGNNNGHQPAEGGEEMDPYAEEEDAGLESSRNTDSSNETTLQEDEDNLKE